MNITVKVAWCTLAAVNIKGAWVDGLKNGDGTYLWSDGTTYIGAWLKGKRHGDGMLTAPKGTVYGGQWINDKLTGKGSFEVLMEPDSKGSFSKISFTVMGNISMPMEINTTATLKIGNKRAWEN